MTTWVKVCGLRTVQDVVVGVEAGANALGLMLAKSPRRITVDEAKVLVQAAGTVDTVLVMVDASVPEASQAVESTGATGVQVYGSHSVEVAAWGRSQGLLVLQPFSVGSRSISDVARDPGVIPLFDTALPDQYGGGGRVFDWSLVREVTGPFVLAGGLGPENVGQAVREAMPWGVDASSGLESSLGVKDHQKIRAFIEGARQNEA